MIHVCNIKTGYGTRVRILAARENVRGPIGDFAVRVIWHGDGKPVSFADATLTDFPRGLGVDGLFGSILTDLSRRSDEAKDENGDVIKVPELTDEQLRAAMKQHYDTYHAIAKELLRRNPPTKRVKKGTKR